MTFTDDLPEGVVSDDPEFCEGDLFAELVVGGGEAGFVVLGHGARMLVPVGSGAVIVVVVVVVVELVVVVVNAPT
jgi:hypothetical protein